MRVRAIGLACIFVFGCAPAHQGTGDDASADTLSIDPPTSELTIVNGTPATEPFTATLTAPDGTTTDVTSEVNFSVDESYGSFMAATLSMTTGGKTNVYASYGVDKIATAQVIARTKDVRVDPNVPPNAPDWFSMPEDPSRAPTVVYPPAGVVMPRNRGDFDVHWTDASTNDTFEISLTTEFTDIRVYVPGGNGTAGTGPDPSWMTFLAAEWTDAVANDDAVTFQVRGVQSSNPVAVGSAQPQEVQLSNEEMLGGIYYWASEGTTSPEGIFRHDMSMPGTPAAQFETEAQTNGRCIACHVLSRDGTEMAITWDGGNNHGNMLDVASKTFQTEANYWNFGTFSPDGSQFLSVYGGNLVVRNYANQAVLGTMTSAGWVTHPDLSPDGTRLVYVRPSSPNDDWSFGLGQIYWRTYDQSSLSFGPEMPLVVDPSATHYYPSFSPDGQWILFNQAASGDAYNNGNAELWVVKSDGSAPPIQLASANVGAGLTDSWGRWAPFAQTLGSASEPMFWVTMSSKRNFGVRLYNAGRPQVWMTPFFPDKATAGTDPTIPAFRLPFQAIDSNNHIAQWTQQVIATQ